jgi:hypothetical protein
MKWLSILVLSLVTVSVSRGALAQNTCSLSPGACTYQQNGSSGGTGYYGVATNGWGMYGYDSGSGVGTQGISATGTGLAGVSDTVYTAPPSGHFGVFGLSSGTGAGVVGLSGTSTVPSVTGAVVGAASGSSVYGGYFTNNTAQYTLYAKNTGTTESNWYTPIFGDATNQTSGGYAGVSGQSASPTGFGVWASDSSSGVGVYGQSSSGYGGSFTSTSGTAIYGTATTDAIVGVYTGTSGSNALKGTTSTGGAGSAAVFGDNTTSTAGGYGVRGVSTNGWGVYGTSASSSTSYAGVWGVNTNGGYGVVGESSSSGGYGVYASGYDVGIYATSSNYAGYFVGNTYTSGNITCGGTCTSDIRLKKNVKPLKGALDELLQLKGVTFEWIDPTKHDNHTSTQEGVIAQDIQKLRPQWVHETPDTHVLTVDPDQRTVLALTVEAFREVNDRANKAEARADKADARADKAERELAEQRAINADHEDRINAIERGNPRAPKSPIGFNAPTGVGVFGLMIGGIALLSFRRKKGEKAS